MLVHWAVMRRIKSTVVTWFIIFRFDQTNYYYYYYYSYSYSYSYYYYYHHH